MKEIKYQNLDEKLYFEQLKNGLSLYIVPKKDFNKTYATFVTNFGALTNRFIPYGEKEYITVPLGVAHFLEHKMFEMSNGEDATNLFSSMGAEANAFTDYEQTAYLVTCTSNVNEVINLLLDYVQEPVFNDENVKKEQGIIIQELMMYLDKPSSRSHLGLLRNLYKENVIREDIVGTVDSINSINKEVLYTCYHTFYHPSNMHLMIVGDVNPYDMLKLVKRNQSKKSFAEIVDLKREFIVEDNTAYKKDDSIKMDILMPKVSVGLKLPYRKYQENELLLNDFMFKILLENFFGSASPIYQEMLDEELINTGFNYSLYLDDFTGFIKISANTNKPEEFKDYVINKLLELKNYRIDEKDFSRIKKAMIGSYIKGLDNPEFIANVYLDYKLKNCDLFTCMELLKDLKVEDLYSLRGYFVKKAITSFTIYPKSN